MSGSDSPRMSPSISSPNHRNRFRTSAVIAVVAAALVASIASSEENEAARVEDGNETTDAPEGNDTDSESAESEPEAFVVGDVVELGDWHVQVHGVSDPHVSEDELFGPSEGHRWVSVDAEVSNHGDSPQRVSSLMCFELIDSEGISYSMALTTDAAQPPDGEIAPGDSRRGTLTYELPDNADGLDLSFQCDLFSTGSAVISLG